MVHRVRIQLAAWVASVVQVRSLASELLHDMGMAKKKKNLQITNAGEGVEKREPPTLLVGM